MALLAIFSSAHFSPDGHDPVMPSTASEKSKDE
jgi:hypothetical protein